MKNIPVPSKQYYKVCMMDKCESLIRRMRWKAYYAEREKMNDNEDVFENYGFKSEKSPPKNDDLIPFERDLFNMILSVKYRDFLPSFQRKLKKDVKDIRLSKDVFVPADKSTNIYKMSKEQYEKLLRDNITNTYKKAHSQAKEDVDREAFQIASKLKLDDRIDKLAENNAFITIKDHKDDFPNVVKCRLINPAKTEIGKISRHTLQQINANIRIKTGLNQWQNTSAVLHWFRNIPNKSRCKFLQMDIDTFYPSISEELLINALRFANSFETIDDGTIDIIMHCRKSLLFDGVCTWAKKINSAFDVTMGSFDGAEICELVGLYLLYQMKNEFPMINFGLYRDDGLGVYVDIPGPQIERIKKNIVQLYKRNGLKITININFHQVNFLDVTLELNEDKFWPYRKPNNQNLYIDKSSNHPPSIIKEVPKMIEKRISELSCSPEEFVKHKNTYEDALAKSGFHAKLNYIPQPTSRRKNRPRNIIWFNPPFNAQVKTDIGKQFITLLNKHFPPRHKFRKLFNKNNVKLSYSCTKNMSSIISSHNKKVLADKGPTPLRSGGCNCRNKSECPMNGSCLENCIVYKGDVDVGTSNKFYIGCTEDEFKTRYGNHKNSFIHRKVRQPTTISGYVWDLKDRGSDYNISWSILKKSFPYRCGSRRCTLCLEEKLLILQADPELVLNKRSELLRKCPHSRKHKLSSFRRKPP